MERFKGNRCTVSTCVPNLLVVVFAVMMLIVGGFLNSMNSEAAAKEELYESMCEQKVEYADDEYIQYCNKYEIDNKMRVYKDKLTREIRLSAPKGSIHGTTKKIASI